jgi:hypothetical protein
MASIDGCSVQSFGCLSRPAQTALGALPGRPIEHKRPD